MPQLPIVIVAEALDSVCCDWLAKRSQLITCLYGSESQLGDYLPDADGLVVRSYTQVNESFLSRAERLAVVGRAGVGIENIDLEACRRRDVSVVYTPDANTNAVVEYVTALILDDLRPRQDLIEPTDDKGFHSLRQDGIGVQLDQLTLGVVGFGRIGQRVGRVAHALGMDVLVNDLLYEEELRKSVEYPFIYVDKQALYQDSDIITLHVDGRKENHCLIDADALAHFKSNSMLINTARGMLVDGTALRDWAQLNLGHGGRAVLDVHEPEPPPLDYPLYGLSNVRLLPHRASRTRTALLNMSWVVRDVMGVLEGRQPMYPAF